MILEYVEVKPAWTSKTNIVAAIGALITIATAFGFDLSEETKVQILTAGGIVVPFIVGVLRTWFTKTITPAVAAKL